MCRILKERKSKEKKRKRGQPPSKFEVRCDFVQKKREGNKRIETDIGKEKRNKDEKSRTERRGRTLAAFFVRYCK